MTENSTGNDIGPYSRLPELPVQRAEWIDSDNIVLRGSKAMYFGDAGSMNWLGVTSERNYPLNERDQFSLRALRRTALCGLMFHSLVSFGPGDGSHDAAILSSLTPKAHFRNGRSCYVPIDISEQFLYRSATAVEGIADVPIAIQCDFERDTALMQTAISSHARRPVLFGMLGGTFANLDLGEERFLNWLRGCMYATDGFLVDIPTAGPDWDVETEPRLHADAYSEPFRRFLAFGTARGESTVSKSLEIRANEVLTNFAERMRFSHVHNSDTGAEEVTVSDSRSGRGVLTFRRYRFSALLSWIEAQGFLIKSAVESSHTIGNSFGMGVIFIQTNA